MQKLNKEWRLKRRPAGVASAHDMEWVEAPVPDLIGGEVLVRNVYLSLDPTNRLWLSDREQYLPPVGLGEVVRGGTVGVVEESRSARFAPGDLVRPAEGNWRLYVVCDERQVYKVKTVDGVPLTAHLSVFGVTGMTAYFGLLDVARPQAGETVVVSAAAGAVGSIVGQIARIKGCRVVGIAGGPDKCRWITEELGFDAAIDYKAEDVGARLDQLCPDGVDIDFENVGGPIMDAVFSRLRQNGRMSLCGLISSYTSEGALAGPSDFGRILMKRLTVKGFIVIDYFPRAREAVSDLSTWIGEGRITWKDEIVDGLENAPDASQRLFDGRHDGKLLVRVSAEP